MKQIVSILIFIITSIGTYAQNNNTQNSLLWKISGKNLKAPSYLYGTIHLICPDNYLWTDVMDSAFHKTQALYLELPMADKGFLQKMMEQLMLTDSMQLKEFFTTAQYQKLDLFFKDSMKIQLDMLSKMKPFGVMSFIMLKYLDCNGSMPISYEEKLIQLAKKQNIPVNGLETIEDQMKIFDDLPKDSIAKMVMSSVDDIPKNRKIFQSMVKAYIQQDLALIYNQIIQSPEYAAHLDALLFNRNAKWISQIIAAAKDKPVFFAVGAGHLAGEKGVLSLLRKQGYTVDPVR